MSRHLRPLEFNKVRITDELFGAYVKKVSEKIIPHQWKILNDHLEDAKPTYCIQNLRIAAKEVQGERKGVVFQDTDLYKWLESVAFCVAGGQGKEYEELADQVIDLISRAQEPDGYLNTYFSVNAPEKKWDNLVEGHELYTAGHMIEAAVAYYEATGKDALLNVAKKNADLIHKVFGTKEGQIPGYPGHQEVELALVKLYRVTGKREYLETAKYFIEQRGKEPNYFLQEMKKRKQPDFFPELSKYDLEYSQSHVPPVHQEKVEGHAVRAMYMCAAMADLAEEYEDQQMKDAALRIWKNVVEKRIYITGGIGSSGFRERFTTDYDLPNRTNYSETCASIGLMMVGQRLASVTQDARYYDTVEQALYNTVLAGINIAGDRYFYVNPLEMVPAFCKEHTYMEHVKPIRQKWFNVACCPPNVARTLASLGQYIYAQDEEAVYIHQYISSTAQATVNQKKVTVQMDSTLLQNGKIHIQVGSENGGTLKLRIPSYAEDWMLWINEKKQSVNIDKGYITIPLTEKNTDLRLDLDLNPKWIGANDRVWEDAGKAALIKGPVVYCLEEKDNGNLLSHVYIKENEKVKEAAPIPELVGNIPSLEYEGIRIKQIGTGKELYGAFKVQQETVTLKAIPYCLWNNRGEGEMLVWQKVKI